MAEPHIEVINPMEKLSVELGGTGYLGPKSPATQIELWADAVEAWGREPNLGFTVWKVLQSSVRWKSYPVNRRLRVGGRVLPCEIIGSHSVWWFVSVNAIRVMRALK